MERAVEILFIVLLVIGFLSGAGQNSYMSQTNQSKDISNSTIQAGVDPLNDPMTGYGFYVSDYNTYALQNTRIPYEDPMTGARVYIYDYDTYASYENSKIGTRMYNSDYKKHAIYNDELTGQRLYVQDLYAHAPAMYIGER